MNYKYDLGDLVQVNSIVKAKAEVIGMWTPETREVNLYQVRLLESEHKDKELWFAEHELKK